jgi:hypothetical protein
MRVVLFYHSLVSDWNHGNAHFLRGVASELIARGHEVAIYEPADGWIGRCGPPVAVARGLDHQQQLVRPRRKPERVRHLLGAPLKQSERLSQLGCTRVLALCHGWFRRLRQRQLLLVLRLHSCYEIVMTGEAEEGGA